MMVCAHVCDVFVDFQMCVCALCKENLACICVNVKDGKAS